MSFHKMPTVSVPVFLYIYKDHVSGTFVLKYLKLPKTSIISSHQVFCPLLIPPIRASVLTLASQTQILIITELGFLDLRNLLFH